MLIPSLSDCLQRHAPRDDVAYLREFAGMVLTITLVAAALVYVSQGGRLVRLAPVP